MSLSSLYKENYKLGYNSRDFPTDIEIGSCQKLFNAFPGATPRPREGICNWNSNASGWSITFDEIIPWSEDEEELILVSGSSFYWVDKDSVTPNLLQTVSVVSGTRFAWARYQDSLYIITNYEENDAAYIISKGSDGFVFRNANIALPAHSIGTVQYTTGSGVSAGMSVALLATLVRRDDSQSYDADGDSTTCLITSSTNNFNPGKLESLGDLDSVGTYEATPQSTFTVTVTITGTIDPQATHLRIYRTLEAADVSDASGLAFRWQRDIPLV